ncbi:hypothetical protein CDD82_7795 [Ophiocordyceps australis]|uniref:Kinesin motor domain-containing protein n=1 Tax=Ophiocordyceps australis TaxID=1399860 RepID=A0A2C5ZPR4_9HYPO|nr:hypothetical protein CDD82_7795 [Ophiocordyceps australis]
MSVRVVARIRPLLHGEHNRDVIVRAGQPERADADKPQTIVKIPNPRNEAEEFSFAFNSVFEQSTSQDALFASEVQPHIKSLFVGFDVTIFAYGVTGTGKTHTMRGGLKLSDRGVIPRLLSGIFRRGKKITKDTQGKTTVRVALSYYEIYNDKIYDLLEPPEKRTPSGLALRAEANGKTVVVGLTQRACQDLKDFDKLYIEANNNRVTAATKLNAHSSRSHAILRVTLTQTTGDVVRESTASAIDLAGSEDNRRTDNDRERLVESAAINKSLFVLSQCIDAISRGDKRIPYRESKMTRILSLGQNNGITIMILNLAPIRSYHLDTLSSLNVSSRAKRIQVREIENEVIFKQVPKTQPPSAAGVIRQPLRPLTNAHNVRALSLQDRATEAKKPVKAFNVYMDKAKPPCGARPVVGTSLGPLRGTSAKRPSDCDLLARPAKVARPVAPGPLAVSAAQIEAMVEKKVSQILAARCAVEQATASATGPAQPEVSEAVQKRLEALERRVESDEWRQDSKSDGLRYLLAARQHKESGDEASALRSYELALAFFPGQAKLVCKIERLRARLGVSDKASQDANYGANGDQSSIEPEGQVSRPGMGQPPTPRTQRFLDVVNSRDLSQIRGLVGFGAKKAQDLVDYMELAAVNGANSGGRIESLDQLQTLPGMGGRTIERAYQGLLAA